MNPSLVRNCDLPVCHFDTGNKSELPLDLILVHRRKSMKNLPFVPHSILHSDPKIRWVANSPIHLDLQLIYLFYCHGFS